MDLIPVMRPWGIAPVFPQEPCGRGMTAVGGAHHKPCSEASSLSSLVDI